jgi:hypothetical protein
MKPRGCFPFDTYFPLMAVWLLAATELSPVASAEPANADGYFCKGCGVIMEHAYHGVKNLIDQRQQYLTAGVSEKIELDIRGKIVEPICDKLEFKDYTFEIKETCSQVIEKNAGVVAHAFTEMKGEYGYEKLYDMTNSICEERMHLCEKGKDVIEWKEDKDQCQLCLDVVQDIQNVLTRKKGSKTYLTRKHIWEVLEAECAEIVFRFGGTRGRRLQSMCEDLFDDYEDEMASAFLSGESPGKNICGKSGAGKCKNRKGQWKGQNSPWMQVPPGSISHNEL